MSLWMLTVLRYVLIGSFVLLILLLVRLSTRERE
jgi:hypothetical protein